MKRKIKKIDDEKVNLKLLKIRKLWLKFHRFTTLNNCSIEGLYMYFDKLYITKGKICPISILRYYNEWSIDVPIYVKNTMISFLIDILYLINNIDDYVLFKKTANISNRKYRLRLRIKEILNENVNCSGELNKSNKRYRKIFGTLTFNEDYINMTNKRRKIRDFLNKTKCHYVANVDYGFKNERVHYHFIISIPEDKMDILNKYPYGYYLYEDITLSDDSMKRLSHYIDKLTNHALKNTTNYERIIYSRCKL